MANKLVIRSTFAWMDRVYFGCSYKHYRNVHCLRSLNCSSSFFPRVLTFFFTRCIGIECDYSYNSEIVAFLLTRSLIIYFLAFHCLESPLKSNRTVHSAYWLQHFHMHICIQECPCVRAREGIEFNSNHWRYSVQILFVSDLCSVVYSRYCCYCCLLFWAVVVVVAVLIVYSCFCACCCCRLATSFSVSWICGMIAHTKSSLASIFWQYA